MTDEKKTTQETVRVPQRVPGFDPMKFARETAGKAGEKVLTLDLKHKKAWFRIIGADFLPSFSNENGISPISGTGGEKMVELLCN